MTHDDHLTVAIEAIRSTLAGARDRIEDLADREGIRGVLDPAAGGVTCVIAALHAAQEHLRRPPATTVTLPSGDTVVVPPAWAAEPDKVVDLMVALEESMAAAKEARSRHQQPAGPLASDGEAFVPWALMPDRSRHPHRLVNGDRVRIISGEGATAETVGQEGTVDTTYASDNVGVLLDDGSVYRYRPHEIELIPHIAEAGRSRHRGPVSRFQVHDRVRFDTQRFHIEDGYDPAQKATVVEVDDGRIRVRWDSTHEVCWQNADEMGRVPAPEPRSENR